jgi:hypothetical protein
VVRRLGEAIDQARADERRQRDAALQRQLEREEALIALLTGTAASK